MIWGEMGIIDQYIYIIYRADMFNYEYSKTSQEFWIKNDHHEMGIINYRLRSFTKGPRTFLTS
jgi:hypothetical protein